MTHDFKDCPNWLKSGVGLKKPCTQCKNSELVTHIAIAIAECCGETIVSSGGGRFVACQCHGSFIDQERWSARYVRLGGKAKLLGRVCPQTCEHKEHKKENKSFGK